MNYALITFTSNSPLQTINLTLTPTTSSLSARLTLRYLPAPDQWVLSITDLATGSLMVNQLPLIASHEHLNDLFAPFAYLRKGLGIGSLYCLQTVSAPSTPDPAKESLTQYQLLLGPAIT